MMMKGARKKGLGGGDELLYYLEATTLVLRFDSHDVAGSRTKPLTQSMSGTTWSSAGLERGRSTEYGYGRWADGEEKRGLGI